MRLRDRLVIWVDTLGGELIGWAGYKHLTTDPACVRYRAPRPGSRIDRISRGHSCGRCMQGRAMGWITDQTICGRQDGPDTEIARPEGLV